MIVFVNIKVYSPRMTNRMQLSEALEVIGNANVRLLVILKKPLGKMSGLFGVWSRMAYYSNNTSQQQLQALWLQRNAAKRLRPIEQIIAELDAVGIDYVSGYKGANYPLKSPASQMWSYNR